MSRLPSFRPTRQCIGISLALLLSLFLLTSFVHPGLRSAVDMDSHITSTWLVGDWIFSSESQIPVNDLPQCSSEDMACVPKARYLSPQILMDRLSTSGQPTNASIPKLIHQSWSSNTLPAKFVTWSDTWRANHPDWEWVLWTDEDNKALVERYFPWFKESYAQLKGEIFRADSARNMYMYAFGG